MPIKRGTRILDARTQSVEYGVGSLPLSAISGSSTESLTGATPSTMLSVPRGRRVAVSGVEEIERVLPTEDVSDNTVLSATAHFKVPAEVLQRIGRQNHSFSLMHASGTDTSSVAAASTSETSVCSGEPGPVLPTRPSTRDSPRRHGKGGDALRSTAEASSASPRCAVGTATATSQIVSSAPEALPHAVEEISEAVVSTTVVAHKTVSSVCAQVDDEAPLRMPRPQKPVIFSRQWRRQLFAGPASSSGSSRPSKPLTGSTVEDVLRSRRQGVGLCERGGVAESGADEEDSDQDGVSPFGTASVIKFSRAGSSDGVSNRAAEVQSSSNSGGKADECSSQSPSMLQTAHDGLLSSCQDGVVVETGEPLTRRQRHQRRKQAQEAREQQRLRRHLAGFDPEYLKRQEAQLLVHKARDCSDDEEDDEEGREHSSQEEGEEDTTNCSVSSTATGDSLSMGSGVGDKEEVAGEGDEDSERDLSESFAPALREGIAPTSGGGFRAAERVESRCRKITHGGGAGTTAAPLPVSVPVGGGGSGSSSSGVGSPSGARSLFLKSFFFACHENPTHSGGCHHTLVGLREAVTIKGPCGIIGFGLGEVSVSGFYLGRKQLTLWHEEHRAVLMPMKRLKTRHAQDMELPQWTHITAPAWPPQGSRTAANAGGGAAGAVGDALGQPLNPVHYHCVPAASGSANLSTEKGAPGEGATEGVDDDEEFLQSLQWNCESVFGEVDWDWVETTVQSWRSLFSNKLPPILLMVQPPSSMRRPGSEGPTRRFYLNRKRGRQDGSAVTPSDAYMDIPSFVAHRSEPSVDVALLPSVVPSIASQGCGSVMVLGSVNIGKSTLCRYIANVLLSQHGLCYWLDLDVGQPEFGVPGQLTLSVLRRPLLRAHDGSCAQMVSAFFLGATSPAQCPLTTANALAAICAQALEVSQTHPVVVNTHGWVLQTGRRISVEALRRLRPRQVIHLHKPQEELWAQDTAALLDPRNGLNAEVVHRRFLVRQSRGGLISTGSGGERNIPRAGGSRRKGKARDTPSSASPSLPPPLCHLPYPHTNEDAAQKSASSQHGSPASSQATPSSPTWRGQVHSVCVRREETSALMAHIKATKGSRGRQQRWERYFSPLLRYYARGTATGARSPQADQNADECSAETTLLEAPLSALHSIVLAERDEKFGDVCLAGPELPFKAPSSPSSTGKTSSATADEQRQRQQTHAEVAAALEHAVVALLFHAHPSPAVTVPDSSVGGRCCIVRSLASLPNGFPVSCYGVVESSEQDLLHGTVAAPTGCRAVALGRIRIRVPLRPSVVAAMLSMPEAGLSSGASHFYSSVSIAYGAALRNDTSFVDVWR